MNGSNPDAQPAIPPTKAPAYSPSTLGVHADDALNSTTDVAPALHVSTTFRYASDPDKLVPIHDTDVQKPPFRPNLYAIIAVTNINLQTTSRNPLDPAPADTHIYSRLSTPNTTRLEAILSQLLEGPTLTYSSGLSAFNALLVYLNPRVVAIGAGYHGCHGVLDIYKKLTHCKVVDLFDESSWDAAGLGKGDVVHLETPLNPTGEAYDIAAFAERAHKRGAVLTVDATFAPPPLQNPFLQNADYVMHSGTKYIGGHSDMLCGIVAISKRLPEWEKIYWSMYQERLFLGSVMGSMEGWLGVRSLRTLELRVERQSKNATELVTWLDGLLSGEGKGADVVKATVGRLQHASLQKEDSAWLSKQMPKGYGPVFAIWMKTGTLAKRLPSKLHLFHHATSLGGVESLIEWRRMSDSGVDERLLRVSIGVENVDDLKADLMAAFEALAAEGGQ